MHHELFSVICQQKRMRRVYLDMLIDSRVRQLDLGLCSSLGLRDNILELVSLRCQVRLL